MILFINKEKIKWERDNLIKRNKIQSLIINKSNIKEQIEFFFEKDEKTLLESACQIHSSFMRLG
jgi:hypothetical protein